MELEWDEDKRQQALNERGLDFADAAAIDLTVAITVVDSRQDYGEDRFVTYGNLNGRLHVVCWTDRNGRMRIISFRKANDREQKLFSTAT